MPDKKLSGRLLRFKVLTYTSSFGGVAWSHVSTATSYRKQSCAAGEANLAKIDGETGQKYMEVAKYL